MIISVDAEKKTDKIFSWFKKKINTLGIELSQSDIGQL